MMPRVANRESMKIIQSAGLWALPCTTLKLTGTGGDKAPTLTDCVLPLRKLDNRSTQNQKCYVSPVLVAISDAVPDQKLWRSRKQ